MLPRNINKFNGTIDLLKDELDSIRNAAINGDPVLFKIHRVVALKLFLKSFGKEVTNENMSEQLFSR